MQQLEQISETVLQITHSEISCEHLLSDVLQQLEEYGCVLRETLHGADRSQFQFRLYHHNFTLYYEDLSDVIWIEFEMESGRIIQDLYRLLQQ